MKDWFSWPSSWIFGLCDWSSAWVWATRVWGSCKLDRLVVADFREVFNWSRKGCFFQARLDMDVLNFLCTFVFFLYTHSNFSEYIWTNVIWRLGFSPFQLHLKPCCLLIRCYNVYLLMGNNIPRSLLQFIHIKT